MARTHGQRFVPVLVRFGLIALMTMQTSCNENQTSPTVPSLEQTNTPSGQTHEQTISDALGRLLTRREGSYVIFEDAATGKIVQFAGSVEEDLLLDLPLVQATDDEVASARALFEELGAPEPRDDDDYGYLIFNMNLGSDVRRATEITIRVFRRVYRIGDDAQLTVTEGD